MLDLLPPDAPSPQEWIKKTPSELDMAERTLSRKAIIDIALGFTSLIISGTIAITNYPVVRSESWLFVGSGFLIFSIYFCFLYLQHSDLALLYKAAKNKPEYTNDEDIDAYIQQREQKGHIWRNLDTIHVHLLLAKKLKDLKKSV